MPYRDICELCTRVLRLSLKRPSLTDRILICIQNHTFILSVTGDSYGEAFSPSRAATHAREFTPS